MFVRLSSILEVEGFKYVRCMIRVYLCASSVITLLFISVIEQLKNNLNN